MAGGSIIAFALIAGLVLPSFGGGTVRSTPDEGRTGPQTELAGTEVPILAGSILEPDQPGTFSEIPPTSGSRFLAGARWGLHEQSIPDEKVIRNLEEGAVVFNHSLTSEQDISDLNSYVQTLPGYPGCYIVHPYPGTPEGSVVMTAWGWTDTQPLANKTAMDSFVNDHRNQGPRVIDKACGSAGTATQP